MQSPAQRLFGAAAAAFDLAVRNTTLSRTGEQKHAESLRHEVRIALLHRLKERYRRLGAFESYFREPRKIRPEEDVRMRRTRDGIRVVDLHWSSDYKTFLPEVQEQYDRVEENQTATARLVLHDSPRPLCILIHGYLGGVHRTERRVWPIHFLRRMGLDVALFVLPFHGPRMKKRFALPPFPGAEPRITNEGFRQAMADFRDLFGLLQERGHSKIGVMGMSLGGFSTALAATLEPKLAFAVPMIPLASIAEAARLNGHIGTEPSEVAAQFKALDAVHRMTSPLHRPLAIDPKSVLIIGAEADRITPIENARKLAEHFGCRMETMHGGHLMQFGRNERFRSVGRLLNELGVVSRSRSAGS